MNKLLNIKIWLLAALTFCLAACSSDDENVNAASELLNAEKEVAFAATETKWQINIQAGCPWEVTAIDKGAWQDLSITPLSGEGNGTIIISTEQNHTSADRTAVITLTTKGGLKQTVNIQQTRSGADLKISQNSFDFTDVASTQTLKVNCNTNWVITGLSGVDWLELDQTSGNGDADVAFKVKESFDDAERTALLTISAGSTGDNTFAIEVNQGGKPLITLSLNTSELPAFAAAGGTQKVKVTCNGAWSATVPSSIGWLHISPTSGIGDAEISVKCDAYTGNQDRLSVLTITAGSKNPQRGSVVITQSY